MPLYEYLNPKTGETREVIQSMSESHVYIDDNGMEWQRLFFSPTTTVKGTPLDWRNPKDKAKYFDVYKKRYDHNKKKEKPK